MACSWAWRARGFAGVAVVRRFRRDLGGPKADRVVDRIPEWKLQTAAVAELDKLLATFGDDPPFTYAASLEGVIGTLNPYQAQLAVASGVKAGEPDLRFYFRPGRLVFVEMKGEKGRLTKSQEIRIPLLRGLGFVVHIVKATSCEEAGAQVLAIVRAELGL